MSVTLVGNTPHPSEDERWRQWSLAYAESGRKSAKQMRFVVALVAIALAIIVAVQVLPQ